LEKEGVLKIDVICFDWNGTLLDDLQIVFEGVKAIFSYFGKPMPPLEEYRREMGNDYLPFYRKRGIDGSRELLNRIMAEKILSLSQPRIFDDALMTISFFRERGVKTALVSLRQEKGLFADLSANKIENFFDFVRAGALNKTEVLKEMLRFFKASARGVISVGDMATDIIAAKNAGVISCGIAHGYHSKKNLVETNPDFLIEHLRELKTIAVNGS